MPASTTVFCGCPRRSKSLEPKAVGEPLFNGGVGVVLVVVTREVALLGPKDFTLTHVLSIFARETRGTARATRLHPSGPLAMVMAGLLVGHFSRSGGTLSHE